MATPLSAPAGFDASWTAPLLNGGVAVAFPPDAALDAAVFAGDGQATLFAPTIAWVSAAAGTVKLTVRANQTAARDPGVYRLQIGVTSGGIRSVAYDGTFEITGSPGAGTPALMWCSSGDIALRSPHVLALLQNRKVDSAGFAGVVAEITAKVARMLVERYDPQPGFVRTRRATPDPTFGLDVPTPAATIPSTAALTAAIAAGGVIVEDRLREIVARLAIALILRRQATPTYSAAADEEESMAMAQWRGYRAQVDLDNDGRPDALVGMDITLLPPGTSP